ncbi:unnamed protein product [Ceutorhynchus assimilis]|uniref:Uncharacterized protein n=1 Tax=Ceutorhynchus assimilis TaxID=467358 RepID=A0A9N9MZC7_9CUCU|nr:unnamed protein product [Ceutorhynchus assimilis]
MSTQILERKSSSSTFPSQDLKASSSPSLPSQTNSEQDDAEKYDLAVKNDQLIQYLDKKKENFEKELIKLQDGIKNNENQLSEKSITEHKKIDDETKNLKSENDNKKKDIATISTEHLKALKNQIEQIQTTNINLQSQNKKYELELRRAVKIVASLNRIVANYYKKASKSICKTTQTNWKEENETTSEATKADCAPGGDSRCQSDPDTENVSDISL